jgi:hypothetical protein
MTGGGASAVSVRSWQARGAGCCTTVLARRCRRKRLDSRMRPGTEGAKRKVTSAVETPGTTRTVRAGSARAAWPNPALHRIAATLRFGMTLNGRVVAARGELGR